MASLSVIPVSVSASGQDTAKPSHEPEPRDIAPMPIGVAPAA